MCTVEQLTMVAHASSEAIGHVGKALQACHPSRRQLLRSALAFSVAPLLGRWPALADTAMPFDEVAPGVFVHKGRYELQSPENEGDMANTSFVVGTNAVAVIDTLGSAKAGQKVRAAIKAVTDKPIRYVINSHMHPDHIFGNAAFKEDQPEFVGHHKLARALSERSSSYLSTSKDMLGADAFEGSEIILPSVSVDQPLKLDLGGRSLVCEAQKTAHTDNDLIITDTATDTVFLADLLFSGPIPTLDGSIRGWLALIEQLEKRTAARVIPGHGPHAMHLPEALFAEQNYWSVVARDVRKIIKDGKSIEDATKTAGNSERDKWQLFDQYHVRNVTAAYAELEWE